MYGRYAAKRPSREVLDRSSYVKLIMDSRLTGPAAAIFCYPPLSLSGAATLAASTRTGLTDRSGI